ncbi:DUF676-domain-containing protein [Cristinia sonorae]|uniref:DUF676-domain-containing protein n=1 Tax=Cristinia sonorae TaxID=1940300 RepID=A0A8K0UUX0_9AGAR|nr:DUF676-domain-containing protein [Cristinia sonorae]
MANNVHLLVLIHGMWGNPKHLDEMKRIYYETRGHDMSDVHGPDGEELRLLVPETNKDSATYDGIDWGGERVAEEIVEEVERLRAEGRTVTRFSVTGYSLGGLIARYAVGVLSQKDFFQDITPVNFSTVATPHLGQIIYKSFRSKLFAYFGPKLLSRTGEQLYTIDDWAETGRPLLDILADSGRIFYKALSTFQRIRFYANSVNDITVPYMTAAVEASDPFVDHTFNGIKIEIDEKYAPIIASFTSPEAPAARPPSPKPFSAKWLKGFVPKLPMWLQFKFPVNAIIIALLPILFPTFIGIAIVRLSLESRGSRSRLRLLEKDETYRERLIHVVGKLERSIEDAALEVMDEGSSPGSPPQEFSEQEAESLLSPTQTRMAKALNALPNFGKELAFIDPVVNSHGTIIARDIKRFKFHEIGHGVLRHLADHFIM